MDITIIVIPKCFYTPTFFFLSCKFSSLILIQLLKLERRNSENIYLTTDEDKKHQKLELIYELKNTYILKHSKLLIQSNIKLGNLRNKISRKNKKNIEKRIFYNKNEKSKAVKHAEILGK